MELMQFTAIVLMIGLTLKLLLLPRRVEENSVTGSRMSAVRDVLRMLMVLFMFIA